MINYKYNGYGGYKVGFHRYNYIIYFVIIKVALQKIQFMSTVAHYK